MTSTLSKEELDDIQSLENRCSLEEGLKNKAYLSNEINFNKELPCFYMAYNKEDLKAFLTTFMPTSEEAEIVAYTAPEERRKGYFISLFSQAKEKMLMAGIKRVLFQVEPKGEAGLKVIESFTNCKLQRSEYTMSCGTVMEEAIETRLVFKGLEKDDKELYVKLNNEIFNHKKDYDNFTEAILSSEGRAAYIAYYEKQAIGIFNLAYEEDRAYCYGVGVLKEHEGKGFGKELMTFALKEGLKHTKKIVLDVDSDNPAAYNLYLKCGFAVDFQVDYYLYELNRE